MFSKKKLISAFLVAGGCLLVAGHFAGCKKENGGTKDGGGQKAQAASFVKTPAGTPTFTLAWSEYPSWSTFGAAEAFGLISGKKGEMGPLETKWGVDIELVGVDYDNCIQLYLNGKADASCLTNMDVLNPALSKQSVGILPTSTSYGADALIVPNSIGSIKDLKGKDVFGLQRSVSEYFFYRVLENLGESEQDYKFSNMDPGQAATQFQPKDAKCPAIVVWQPFVNETLNKRADSKRLFDSKNIPAEIIDMVQVSQSSLDKPGGKNFACLVIDIYYSVNRRLADPATRKETVSALAERFAKLDNASMEKVLTDCRFFSTPEAGLALLNGEKVMINTEPDGKTPITQDNFKDIMPRVVKFSVKHKIADKEPTVAFGDKASAPDANFRLDPTYIKAYLEHEKAAPAK